MGVWILEDFEFKIEDGRLWIDERQSRPTFDLCIFVHPL